MNKTRKDLSRKFRIALGNGLRGVSELENYIARENQLFLNYEYPDHAQHKITDKQAKEMVNTMTGIWELACHLPNLNENDADNEFDNHPATDMETLSKNFGKFSDAMIDIHLLGKK